MSVGVATKNSAIQSLAKADKPAATVPSATDHETLPSTISLFKTISKQAEKLSRQELVDVIGRVLEHAPGDGIALIKEYKLTKDEFLRAWNSKAIVLKHPTFAENFHKVAKEYLPHACEEELTKLQTLVFEIGNDLSASPRELPRITLTGLRKRISKFIDNFYAKYLKGKEATPKTQIVTVPTHANDYLKRKYREIKGEYYRGAVVDVLFREVWERNQVNPKTNKTITQLASGFFSKEILHGTYKDFDDYLKKMREERKGNSAKDIGIEIDKKNLLVYHYKQQSVDYHSLHSLRYDVILPSTVVQHFATWIEDTAEFVAKVFETLNQKGGLYRDGLLGVKKEVTKKSLMDELRDSIKKRGFDPSKLEFVFDAMQKQVEVSYDGAKIDPATLDTAAAQQPLTQLPDQHLEGFDKFEVKDGYVNTVLKSTGIQKVVAQGSDSVVVLLPTGTGIKIEKDSQKVEFAERGKLWPIGSKGLLVEQKKELTSETIHSFHSSSATGIESFSKAICIEKGDNHIVFSVVFTDGKRGFYVRHEEGHFCLTGENWQNISYCDGLWKSELVWTTGVNYLVFNSLGQKISERFQKFNAATPLGIGIYNENVVIRNGHDIMWKRDGADLSFPLYEAGNYQAFEHQGKLWVDCEKNNEHTLWRETDAGELEFVTTCSKYYKCGSYLVFVWSTSNGVHEISFHPKDSPNIVKHDIYLAKELSNFKSIINPQTGEEKIWFCVQRQNTGDKSTLMRYSASTPGRSFFQFESHFHIDAVHNIENRPVFECREPNQNRISLFDQNRQRVFLNFDRIMGIESSDKHCMVWGWEGTSDDKFVICRKVFDQSYSPNQNQSLALNEDEKKLLSTLNLVEFADENGIYLYLRDRDSLPVVRGAKNRARDFYTRGYFFRDIINSILRSDPITFISTMGAKQDKVSKLEIDRLIGDLFPIAGVSKEISEANLDGSDRSTGKNYAHKSKSFQVDPFGIFRESQTSAIDGGDPETLSRVERVLLRSRESINDWVIYGTYFGFDKGSNRWISLNLDIAAELSEPVKEYTFEFDIPKDHVVDKVKLPPLLGARIIRERVKGIDTLGKEIKLTTESSIDGGILAVLPERTPKISKVVFSMSRAEKPADLKSVTAKDYAKFKAELERKHSELQENFGRLPEDVRRFLHSIKDLDPLSKIEAIQEYADKIFYYDQSNAEFEEEKEDVPLDELFALMKFRMQELRQNDPTIASSKQYAGVCADFGKFGPVIHKEAGLVAGAIKLLKIVDGLGQVKKLHACSAVLWPGDNDTVRLVRADLAPRNSGIEILDESENFDFDLDEVQIEGGIVEALSGTSINRIKALENGELESFVNQILPNLIKEQHLGYLEFVLAASRYAGLELENKDSGDWSQFESFVPYGLEVAKMHIPITDIPAGQKFLSLLQEFSRKLEIDGSGDTLAHLEKVLDHARGIDELTYKAAIGCITYLRAKKMAHPTH